MYDIDLAVLFQMLQNAWLWVLSIDWPSYAEVVRFLLQTWESSLKIRTLRKQLSNMDKPVTIATRPPRYRGRKRDSRLRRRMRRTRK